MHHKMFPFQCRFWWALKHVSPFVTADHSKDTGRVSSVPLPGERPPRPLLSVSSWPAFWHCTLLCPRGLCKSRSARNPFWLSLTSDTCLCVGCPSSSFPIIARKRFAVWPDHSVTIHPLVKGHPGDFQSAASMNKAAISVPGHASVGTHILNSLGLNRIVFASLKKKQDPPICFFQSCSTVLQSRPRCVRAPRLHLELSTL